jgi:nitroimidazol reductase NimA-like FMN-containing flavoprotein (pyridoxamine 5'-phosphate oxidase superfamily)
MTRITPLTVAACWSALAGTDLGRIGFDLGRGPRIHPVTYALDGRSVLVATAADTELALFEELFSAGALVAFEVDEVDRASRTGWSVLLSGHLTRVAAREALPDLRPWADGDRSQLMRIVPVEVTGRRLDDAPAPASAG